MLKRTLVGYDGSESARRAFRLAVTMMRATEGHVYVLSVLQVTEAGADATAMMMTDKGDTHAEELKATLTALAPNDTDIFDVDVVYGSPGDVLLAEVAKHSIDHIIIGHTERGALLRWLLGSVSKDIIARADVPVTVVR